VSCELTQCTHDQQIARRVIMKNIILAATLIAGSASAAPPSATGSGFREIWPANAGRPGREGAFN